ncbi:MAG: MFS transporter [Flavobacterium sp.]
MKNITRTVWILSLVSLFTDTATEMLYPIMPIYLKTIGFSVVLIGVLEGVAEATTGLSKGYFGKLSDNTGKRVPFVQLGYLLSGLSRPMMGMFVYPLWIFLSRTMDRFGKGIRTAARDAILSGEATTATKGKIFGFHRSLDTFGAVLGPTFALIYLYIYPEDYRTLFFVAFIPSCLAILASLILKDKKQPQIETPNKYTGLFSFLKYWKTSPLEYRKVTIGLLGFALFNSSDVFLLLKAKQSGLSDTMTIMLYIFYNLVYALCAFPLGIYADKIGLKKIYLIGLSLFTITYFGMGFTTNHSVIIGCFMFYGIYSAATEGVSRAWISNITDKKDTATAIGTYAAFQSICTMIASSLAGFLWYQFGAEVTFIVTGITTTIIILYFVFSTRNNIF